MLPADIRKEHWPIDDPAKVAGSEEEVMAVFRESRDDIRLRVEELIKRLSDKQGHGHND